MRVCACMFNLWPSWQIHYLCQCILNCTFVKYNNSQIYIIIILFYWLWNSSLNLEKDVCLLSIIFDIEAFYYS